MDSRTLKESALKAIDSYLNYSNGSVCISVPYFNNRRGAVRAGLRAQIGKGSITDIQDEIDHIAIRERIDVKKLTTEEFKKFLVNNDIGIDCSGFIYHVLNQESLSRNKGALRKHLSHPSAKNIIRKIIIALRPIENTGVHTFAHDSNSRIVPLQNIEPGDMITMTYTAPNMVSYNHIILIYQVDYENNLPTTLHYAQSMAWPSDGEYKHGVRLGEIKITDINKPITEQEWIENGKTGAENFTHARALNASSTQIRRLKWF